MPGRHDHLVRVPAEPVQTHPRDVHEVPVPKSAKDKPAGGVPSAGVVHEVATATTTGSGGPPAHASGRERRNCATGLREAVTITWSGIAAAQ